MVGYEKKEIRKRRRRKGALVPVFKVVFAFLDSIVNRMDKISYRRMRKLLSTIQLEKEKVERFRVFSFSHFCTHCKILISNITQSLAYFSLSFY
jgi:hypothetical protein